VNSLDLMVLLVASASSFKEGLLEVGCWGSLTLAVLRLPMALLCPLL
jgi:hypothetical protein